MHEREPLPKLELCQTLSSQRLTSVTTRLDSVTEHYLGEIIGHGTLARIREFDSVEADLVADLSDDEFHQLQMLDADTEHDIDNPSIAAFTLGAELHNFIRRKADDYNGYKYHGSLPSQLRLELTSSYNDGVATQAIVSASAIADKPVIEKYVVRSNIRTLSSQKESLEPNPYDVDALNHFLLVSEGISDYLMNVVRQSLTPDELVAILQDDGWTG